MENQDYQDYGDDFIINLSIDGTEFEEVEVKVEDPHRSISDLINNIIREFELPKMDNGGNPIEYLLGRADSESDEAEIFQFEDENGYDLCLLDYDVKPGDNLNLERNIIAG